MSCSFKCIIQNAYDAIVHQVVGMEGNIPMFQRVCAFFLKDEMSQSVTL